MDWDKKLIEAIKNWDMNLLNEALYKGANPNGKEGARKSPLARALREGSALSTERLLEAGADPNGVRGDTFWECFNSPDAHCSERLKRLIKAGGSIDINLGSKSQPSTPLSRSLDSRYLQTASELVRMGARLTNDMAERAAGMSLDLLESMLDRGMDPNAESSNGWKPMERYVAEFGDVEGVDRLLKRGARPDARSGKLSFIAASYGRFDLMLRELRVIDNADEFKAEAATCLGILLKAAQSDSPEGIKGLLALGEGRGVSGDDLLAYVDGGQGLLVLILSGGGLFPSSELLHGKLDACSGSITFDPSAVNKAGMTPLHILTTLSLKQEGEMVDLARRLIDIGVDPKVRADLFGARLTAEDVAKGDLKDYLTAVRESRVIAGETSQKGAARKPSRI